MKISACVAGRNEYYIGSLNGGVAQLVRAPACHAGGCEFESRHSRHSLRDRLLGLPWQTFFRFQTKGKTT